jgi:50S ribosomal subunit-associated GTPase HflX
VSLASNSIIKILNEIGHELIHQISLANSIDARIDSRKLAQQSDTLNDAIQTSELSDEDKSMLQKFSLTLVQDNSTVKSLRYEKQDLERVLSNITNL